VSAVTDRGEAQKEREEARRRRRAQARPQADEAPAEATPSDDGGHGPTEPEHESLRSAAKVAAAGAAVGAALGAARALTTRERDDEEDGDPQDGDETMASAEPSAEEHDEPEPEREPDPEREPEPERDPEPEAVREDSPQPSERNGAPGREPVAGATPDETTEVVRRARAQLVALHGSEPESLSSLARTPAGWTATFEVVELARVPDSTDVLASYEVVLDEDKNVTRYARVRRYYRAQADDGGGA
jgi:hypothetical protein